MSDKWITTRVLVLNVGPECKSGVKVGDVGLVGVNTTADMIRHKNQPPVLVIDEVQLYGIEMTDAEIAEENK